MPELPEVETVRKRMEKALQGKKITAVHADEADRFLFAHAPLAKVRKALLGTRVKGSGRKGKYFWLQLDEKKFILFHLGMTGNVVIRSADKSSERAWGGVRLWSGSEEGGERNWFARLVLTAADGTEVALTDPRRFGRLWITDAPLLHPRVKKLGFDPLQSFPSAKELVLLLKKRKAPVKAVLLDQKLFAGVGNWIADEILFQARIAPARPACSLSSAEVARLRTRTVGIMEKAVAVEADYGKFPANWLFHHRWGKDENARTSTKRKIRHDEFGGRTTAWVPALQK